MKNKPIALILSYILAIALFLLFIMVISGCGTRKTEISKTLEMSKVRRNLDINLDIDKSIKTDIKTAVVNQKDFKTEWETETVQETFMPTNENGWRTSRKTTRHKGNTTDKGNTQTQTKIVTVEDFKDHSQITDNYDSLSQKKYKTKNIEADKTLVNNVGGKLILLILTILFLAFFIFRKKII